MNSAEFRRRAYSVYYSTLFGCLPSNRPQEAVFKNAAKGFEKNYSIHLASLKKASTILDVGCGVGHFVYFLLQQGFQAEGVDHSEQQLEQARNMIPEEVPLHCEDAAKFLRERPNKYDAIICNAFIEHLTRPEALAFSDIAYTSLKANGVFVFLVPNAASPSGMELLYRDATHECAYTETSAAQLLGIAKFQHIRVTPFEASIKTPFHIAPWLARRLTWNLYKLRLFLHDFSPGPRVVSRGLVASGVKVEN